MSTRYSKHRIQKNTLQSGYELDAQNANELIPSCGVEDVDKSVFDLFSDELPLYYKDPKSDGGAKRVPVIFSTGERFAILSKSSPLRDKNGALILPMVSISRNGIEMDPTKPMGTSDRIPETVVYKKLSKSDGEYQHLINSYGLKNSGVSSQGLKNETISTGRMLGPRLSSNIYEIISIPTPKYFTAKYEVVVWCQYMQHMNSIIETIMGSYIQPGGHTIKLKTKKGYWFLAFFDKNIAQDNNTSDFSDTERIIKITMNIEVPAYLILPSSDGIPTGIKKYTSAPVIAFEMKNSYEDKKTIKNDIGSSDLNKYILSDVMILDDVIGDDEISGKSNHAVISADAFEKISGIQEENDVSMQIGNNRNIKKKKIIDFDYDPLGGTSASVKAYRIDSNSSKGEEVYVIELYKHK